MSLLTRLRAALAAPAVAAGDVRRLSPYDDVNHLARLDYPEWFGPAEVTRSAAMAVPAVSRARRVICNSIGRMPLRAYRSDVPLPTQPSWIDRTDGPVSPYHRMVWTVDDLLFYGWSCWAVNRSESSGAVIAADRVPFDAWHIDDAGRVVWRDPDGVDVIARNDSVILIPGGDAGLLADSAGAIRHAANLLAAADKAADTPAAYLELHQTNEYPLTEAERDRILKDWRAARRGDGGGVALTSAGIEVKEHGTFDAHLLVEGRNAAALDVARAMGMPGSVVDATVEKASLNYETTESKARDLIDYGLSAFMSPISARLGMDDVVPRGVAIKFDLEDMIGPGATRGTPDDATESTPAEHTNPTPETPRGTP